MWLTLRCGSYSYSGLLLSCIFVSRVRLTRYRIQRPWYFCSVGLRVDLDVLRGWTHVAAVLDLLPLTPHVCVIRGLSAAVAPPIFVSGRRYIRRGHILDPQLGGVYCDDVAAVAPGLV